MLWLPAPRASAAHLRRACVALFMCLGFMLLPALRTAVADPAPSKIELEARNRQIKQIQVSQMMEGARLRMSEARARAAWNRWAAKHGKRGQKVREANGEAGEMAPPPDVSRARIPATESATSSLAVPTNVRCNNPAGDAAGAGQAEESIASWGNYVLVAWNDGQGFPTSGDVQGYAYSTDGGATFTDGGTPPHLGGWPTRAWSSDPVVTVNEKTGEFYYCGLTIPSGSTNGVGIVRATFPGGVFTWDTPRVVVTYNNVAAGADKQWIAADSSNGNLYVSWTKFDVSDSVLISRSTNNGVSWSPPLTMNLAASAGLVQGSRVAVGPAGEVYCLWSEIGPVDADFYQIRKSINAGVSFTGEVLAASVFSNFGTGAPGFNRERGIYYPGLTVDRTTGTNRGRVYVVWNETINWYDDALGGVSNNSEVENNNFFSRANTFAAGQRLRGAINSTTDGFDYWKFSATQGTSYIFWCDSIPTILYTMRIFCTDTLTRLTYSGDINAPAGGNGFIVWAAPTTATYYLRMAFVSGGATSGGYRIQSGTNSTPGPEPGRDTRDIMVAHSDDGSTWSTPARINDDAAYYDDWLPEVSVGADGCPYVMWFDWRDSPAGTCGGQSHIYMSRSGDGGTTWAANQRISSTIAPWTTIASNIAPNQGDYSNLFSDGRYVRPNWAQGIGTGDADVWTTSIDTYHDITVCQNDTSANNNSAANLKWIVTNRNVVFDNTYSYVLTNARGWPMPASSTLPVTAGGSGTLTLAVNVPDSAAAGINQICLKVTNAKGTLMRQCCTNLTVVRTIGVGTQPLAFALHPSVPNPSVGTARIDFNLPATGAVRLVFYGLGGERVRTLVNGVRAAGPNSAVWDGRNDRGHVVGPGAYFYRLEAFGQSLTRRMVFMP